MAAEEQHDVVIVGAGIAGLATAAALRIVGQRDVVVLERHHELRTTGTAINLFPNAWPALEALGVAHKLSSRYDIFEKGHVVNVDSGVTQEAAFAQAKNRHGTGARSVHRKALLEALAEGSPPGAIRFCSKVVSVRNQDAQVSPHYSTSVHLDDGSVIKAKMLIGCDGLHSVVAQWLGLRPPVDSGRSGIRGLSVFPEGHGFENGTYQFVGQGMRGGAFTVNSKEMYWFLLLKSTSGEHEILRDPEIIVKEVTEHLAKDFPEEFLRVVRRSELSSLTWAPLMLRVPWDVILGRTHRGCVTVAGDAMHPMTPDLGQGGCSALEDAVVLARSVGRAGSRRQMEQGIERYAKERRWRAAGLIAFAYVFGFVQQADDTGLWQRTVRWFRDNVFYKYIYTQVMMNRLHCDCGALAPLELDARNLRD